MHRAVRNWFRQLWAESPELFHGRRVLECGSRLVGDGQTIAPFFADCAYTGLDALPGPGVDVISLIHEYRPAAPFDVVVCCQVLEHDPHWRESVAHMIDLTAPGGTLLLTFPGVGWPRHGDGDMTPEPGYYHNPDRAEVVEILTPGFDRVECKAERLDVFVLASGRKAVE